MNSTSVRGMQSFLFAEGLRKQLDAMESKSASSRAKLEKRANSYRDMGLNADEIKELMVIDSGTFVKEAVDAFVDVVAGEDDTEVHAWDYSILDNRGKKWSASSYGLRPVMAATVEEATELASRKLRMLLDEENGETVTDVERII